MDFTPEEKVDIVFEGMNNDIKITELCEKYNISRKTYYDWKKAIKASAINKWENTKVGRNPKDEVSSLQEANKIVAELKEEIISLEEAVEQIDKEKRLTELQRDYIKFRLTESGEAPELQEKNLELLKKKQYPARVKKWVLSNHEDDYQDINVDEYTSNLDLVESTFFNWQNRAENDQLEDKSSEPEEKPNKTDQDRLIEALKVIVKHPDWGGVKVCHYLLNKEICYLSPSTINRIKANLNECLDLSELDYVQRYEFINSNDCWSLDFTQFNWGDEKLYLCFLQDDHSRFIIDWDITASPTCKFVKDLLRKAFKQHGTPDTIKSDNGPQFRNQFFQFLESWLIKHHVSPYYTPSYNGKVERKNLDFKEIIKQVNYECTTLEDLFVILGNAVYEHNNIRPHQSLGGVTPKQEYEGFGDKVRAKMEAFKKKEKELKGFKTKKKIVFSNDENEAKVKGIIVPAFLINDPEKTAGYVKKLIEI